MVVWNLFVLFLKTALKATLSQNRKRLKNNTMNEKKPDTKDHTLYDSIYMKF